MLLIQIWLDSLLLLDQMHLFRWNPEIPAATRPFEAVTLLDIAPRFYDKSAVWSVISKSPAHEVDQHFYNNKGKWECERRPLPSNPHLHRTWPWGMICYTLSGKEKKREEFRSRTGLIRLTLKRCFGDTGIWSMIAPNLSVPPKDTSRGFRPLTLTLMCIYSHLVLVPVVTCDWFIGWLITIWCGFRRIRNSL